MKRLAVVATVAGLLMLPGVARAGAATDAALGLGAFAVFNQILSGTGIFGGTPAAVAAPAPPVYVAPAPIAVAPPPPPVYVAPVYVPAPPVYVAPPPVAYVPAPRVIYPRPVYYARPHWVRAHRWEHRR